EGRGPADTARGPAVARVVVAPRWSTRPSPEPTVATSTVGRTSRGDVRPSVADNVHAGQLIQATWNRGSPQRCRRTGTSPRMGRERPAKFPFTCRADMSRRDRRNQIPSMRPRSDFLLHRQWLEQQVVV